LTDDSLQVFAEDGEEFLDNNAAVFQILKDFLHVLGADEDIADAAEVPTLDGLLRFNGHLGLVEFEAPALEKGSTLADDANGLARVSLQDRPDVDLLADFGANLV